MNALRPEIYADLVGKPFVPDARGPSAYDCLGLCIEICRRRGYVVPPYESTPGEFARHYTESGPLGICLRINAAEAGAIVLMRGLDGRGHMGVMVDPYDMLHASEDAGQVVRETLHRSAWARRVRGFYFLEPHP